MQYQLFLYESEAEKNQPVKIIMVGLSSDGKHITPEVGSYNKIFLKIFSNCFSLLFLFLYGILQISIERKYLKIFIFYFWKKVV